MFSQYISIYKLDSSNENSSNYREILARLQQPKEAFIKKKLKRSYKNFEETFLILLEKAKEGPVSLETFLTILSGKGKILLLIFFSLSFGQIPVLAIFLGLVISYLGLRMAINRSSIWMPKALLHKKIPSAPLIKAIKQILHFLKFMKRWSHPCFVEAVHRPSTRVINGLLIALVGISIAISPPVPFSGLIAYVAIFLIAIGFLNDDGIYVIVGDICALLYFITVLFLCKFCSMGQMWEWTKSGVAYLF